MPWAFTFRAFGPGPLLYDSKELLLAGSVIMPEFVIMGEFVPCFPVASQAV